MSRIKFLFLVLAFLILACNALTQPLLPTSTPTESNIVLDPNCPNPQPSQKEIDFALQFKDEHFGSPGWKNSYTVMEYRVSVTWKNDDLGAVANIDHIIFCDATNAALDEYYTPANFDIVFQNYQGNELQKDCRSDDLRLYEFKVESQGFDYNARFWIELVDGDHIRETLLVFPVDDDANMDLYSRKIMPDLSSCE